MSPTEQQLLLLLQVKDRLCLTGKTVVTAESCTGGLLAGLLTELPGSSQWFERGFVVYSNTAKEELLQVDPRLLKEHGAVSGSVAEAMAKGALEASHAAIALAVTGIAGPDGGSSQKPVGTVWFGFAIRDSFVRSEHCYFNDESRQKIRTSACYYTLERLLSFLRD